MTASVEPASRRAEILQRELEYAANDWKERKGAPHPGELSWKWSA